MRALCCAVLLALAVPARCENDVEGVSQETDAEAETLRQLQATLQSDPRVADSLAARIQRSRLAAKITGAQDADTQFQDIRKWISLDPASAAQIGIGLSQDDAEGSHRFEAVMDRKVKSHLELNPDSRKGIYGRLKKTGVDSKLIKKESGEEMSEEEKRELIKDMFEGKGGMSGQVVNQAEDGKTPDPSAAVVGGKGLPPNYFDRLGQGNLRGYSPQLMAIQSWLNGHGAPGAPRLIETGKLDYATLSYPAYAMRFDVKNLEQRLRLQQNYELARQLGLNLKPAQLLDAKVESELKAKAAAAKLSPRFARRRAALSKAQAALSDFDGTALLAQNPDKISRALLQSLGSKQKEAARWITVASLEEELQRLEEQEGFLSAELRALIDACPAAEAVKAAYKRRGESYQARLRKIKDNNEAAIKALESDGWLAAVAQVEERLGDNEALRKDLFRNIKDFVNTPYRLRSLYAAQPRWREYLDNAAKRYFSSTAYAKKLLRVDAQRALLKEVFSKIASGDLDAAHTILASYEPSAGPPSKR